MSEFETIARILDEATLQFVTEDDLQRSIALVLVTHNITADREVKLSDRTSRIDLLAGTTGIEVKIDSSYADVIRQLTRYAHCPEIHALILITSRVKHHKIPRTLAGKPVHLVSLVGSAL